MTDMNVSNMLVEQFIIDFEEVFMGVITLPFDDMTLYTL